MTFISAGLAYLFFRLVKAVFIILVLSFSLFFIVQKIRNYYDSSIGVDFRKILGGFYTSIKYGVLFPLLLMFCFILYHVPSMYRAYRVCVEFPNGVQAGWISFIKVADVLFFLDLNFLYPDWAARGFRLQLKSPDGKVLLRGDVDSLHFSKTTIFGYADPMVRRSFLGIGMMESLPRRYAFVYRPDVGLVKRYENPKLYNKIKEEAGELISKNLGYRRQNLGFVFFDFRQNPAYRRENCPLDIFP